MATRGRKSHAESEVERAAVRLWASDLWGDQQFDRWSMVKALLWGMSDGLRIAGKGAAAELAEDLGWLAAERAIGSISS